MGLPRDTMSIRVCPFGACSVYLRAGICLSGDVHLTVLVVHGILLMMLLVKANSFAYSIWSEYPVDRPSGTMI